jgi:hypothetical protein
MKRQILAWVSLSVLWSVQVDAELTVDRSVLGGCKGGDIVEVRLTLRDALLDDDERPHNLLIEEHLPAGWSLRSAVPEETAQQAGTRTVASWLFSGSSIPLAYACEGGDFKGEACESNLDCRCAAPTGCPNDDSSARCVGTGVIDYDAAAIPLAGTATFQGRIVEYRGDMPMPTAEVGGITELPCASPPVSVARTIVSPECGGNSPIQVRLHVSLAELSRPSLLTVIEQLPPGWELTEPRPQAARIVPSRNEAHWDLIDVAGPTTTIEYLVHPPNTADGARRVQGRVRMATGGELTIEGDEQLTCTRQIVGDCNASGCVTVEEIIKGVNIALEQAPVLDCPSFDASGDRAVTVDEITQAVNVALVCSEPGVSTTSRELPQLQSHDAQASILVIPFESSSSAARSRCLERPEGASSYLSSRDNSLALGRGFDPVDPQREYQPCIAFQGESWVDGAIVDSRVAIEEIETRNELYRTIGFDASASARNQFINARSTFSRSTSQSFLDDSFTFVVSANIDFGRFQMNNPRLVSEMQALVSQGRSADFLARCGSMYVSSVRKGLRYSLIYTVDNLSRSEVEDLRATFSATYAAGVVNASADAAWRQALQGLSRRRRVRVEAVVSGGRSSSIELQACLVNGDLNAVSRVKGCLETLLRSVQNDLTQGTPTEYTIGSMTTFGVSACFQAGVRERDRVLTEIFRELEDAQIILKRLDSLDLEIALNLVDGDDLADRIGEAARGYQAYARQLEELGRNCASDAENDFQACATHLEAGLVRPRVPLELAELLYDQEQWSFLRWCRGAVSRFPEVAPGTPAGNTVDAILTQVQGASSTKNVSCPTAQFALRRGRSEMQLRGFPSYDARPLQVISGLANLFVEGNGTFLCGGQTTTASGSLAESCSFSGVGAAPCERSLACMATGPRLISVDSLKRHDGLRRLALRGLGLDDFTLGTLLERFECASGSRAGMICSSSRDCPGSSCRELGADEVWPQLAQLDLEANSVTSLTHNWPTSLRELSLRDNLIFDVGLRSTVDRALAPLTKLTILNVEEPVERVMAAGLIRNIGMNGATGDRCYQINSPENVRRWEQSTARALTFFLGLNDALQTQLSSGRSLNDLQTVQARFSYRGAAPPVCEHCSGTVPPEPQVCNPLVRGGDELEMLRRCLCFR